MDDQVPNSTRPYLLRALHEWCVDSGLTPYIVVHVDSTVQVPREFVNKGEIVLNIGLDATGDLLIGKDMISFKARFAGRARDILVPVNRVAAIYARENGQGMAFATDAGVEPAPVPGDPGEGDRTPAPREEGRTAGALQSVKGTMAEGSAASPSPRSGTPPPKGGRRPTLKRIK